MEKKKNRKKIIIAVIVIVLAVIGLISYMVVTDMKQEDVLRDEISAISKKDITKDRYKDSIKTKKDYAVVEKAIKDYLDKYAGSLQGLLKIIDEKQFTNLLSAENYKTDGPDFVKSKEYLTKTKNDFNDELNELAGMTSEKTIMKNIETKTLNSYYENLYRELMLNGIAETDFETSQKKLKTASDKINKVLNVQEEVINFLIVNKGKWSIQNDKIIFQDTNNLNEYNTLISKLSA